MSRTTQGGRRLTRAGLAAFLDALAETGMVCEAAAQAGVPRASLYRKKAADADFAAAWAAALETGLDRPRDEAVRRAYQGVEETVWYRGEAVGTVRRYSDALLMFLLRAHQPAVYREPRGNAEAAARSAEKTAARAEVEQDQRVADAYELGKQHGLQEFLDVLNGETRGIRDGEEFDEPYAAEGGDAAGDAGAVGREAEGGKDGFTAAELARQRADGPPGFAPAAEPEPPP